MAKKKYEIDKDYSRTMPDGTVLHRIRALKDLPNVPEVKKGDLGGWVEGFHNLSQEGDSWLYDNAAVYQDACLSDDAVAYDNVILCGNARVYNVACAYRNSKVSGHAHVHGCSFITDYTHIKGSASISGNAGTYGKTVMDGDSQVRDNVILVDAKISGETVLCNGVSVYKTHIKKGHYEGAYTISFPVSSRDEFVIYDGVIEDARGVNSVIAHTSKNLWSFESKNFKSDKALKKYFAKRGYKHFSRMKALMKFHRKMFNIGE